MYISVVLYWLVFAFVDMFHLRIYFICDVFILCTVICTSRLICLCLGFTAQSTQWGHVEHGQFT